MKLILRLLTLLVIGLTVLIVLGTPTSNLQDPGITFNLPVLAPVNGLYPRSITHRLTFSGSGINCFSVVTNGDDFNTSVFLLLGSDEGESAVSDHLNELVANDVQEICASTFYTQLKVDATLNGKIHITASNVPNVIVLQQDIQVVPQRATLAFKNLSAIPTVATTRGPFTTAQPAPMNPEGPEALPQLPTTAANPPLAKMDPKLFTSLDQTQYDSHGLPDYLTDPSGRFTTRIGSEKRQCIDFQCDVVNVIVPGWGDFGNQSGGEALLWWNNFLKPSGWSKGVQDKDSYVFFPTCGKRLRGANGSGAELNQKLQAWLASRPQKPDDSRHCVEVNAFGHSMGGVVVEEAVRLKPELYSRATTYEPSYGANSSTAVFWPFMGLFQPCIMDIVTGEGGTPAIPPKVDRIVRSEIAARGRTWTAGAAGDNEHGVVRNASPAFQQKVRVELSYLSEQQKICPYISDPICTNEFELTPIDANGVVRQCVCGGWQVKKISNKLPVCDSSNEDVVTTDFEHQSQVLKNPLGSKVHKVRCEVITQARHDKWVGPTSLGAGNCGDSKTDDQYFPKDCKVNRFSLNITNAAGRIQTNEDESETYIPNEQKTYDKHRSVVENTFCAGDDPMNGNGVANGLKVSSHSCNEDNMFTACPDENS